MNMLNSLKLTVLSLICVASLGAASPAKAATVCTQSTTLNVREYPTTNSGVVTQLQKGAKVEVMWASSDYAWYFVYFRLGGYSQFGWVNADYICH